MFFQRYEHDNVGGYAKIVRQLNFDNPDSLIPDEYYELNVFCEFAGHDSSIAEAITKYGKLYNQTLESCCYLVLSNNLSSAKEVLKDLEELRKPETMAKLVNEFYIAIEILEIKSISNYKSLDSIMRDADYYGLSDPKRYWMAKTVIDLKKHVIKLAKGDLDIVEELKLVVNFSNKNIDFNGEAYYYQGEPEIYSIINL